ncbi:ATP-grasp domain-containing protein [Pseudolysinimonas sp.]|uniref:ATP-grasp domain-containing protein n=1 Tax=Pseudolysinimonas sp. TaxID=2680009 RepID=UPI0032679D81
MLNILVTGAGGGGVGEQLIKTVRLSGIESRIVATDTSRVSTATVNADAFAVVPIARNESYLNELLALSEREGIDVLLPGSEAELRVISDNREHFERLGIFLPINPKSVIDLSLDKSRTAEFFTEHALAFPRSATITSAEDLERVDFLPAVLKPSIGGGGSANIMLAQSLDELRVFGQYLLRIYPEFVVQEYVGTEESEYTVGVLLDMDGGLVNSIAMRRIIRSGLGAKLRVANRTARGELGEYLAISSGISQGEFVAPFELNRECERIAVELGARAAINIQCRWVDGQAIVFEVNPRFSGTSSSRALVGYNELAVLLRARFEGIEPERGFAYRHGYVLRGLQERFVPVAG